MEIEIQYDRYAGRIMQLSLFHQYARIAFGTEEALSTIRTEQIGNLLQYGKPFMIDKSESGEARFRASVEKNIDGVISYVIEQGTVILRRQLLEAAFSVFESFLAHLVEVYLRYFPQLLNSPDKTLSYLEIMTSHKDGRVIDLIIEKELKAFSYRSIAEKKDFLSNKLKLADPSVWVLRGQEKWKDINKNRQDIVHVDKEVPISETYLEESIEYLNSVMLKLSAFSQADHGIPFKWMKDSADNINRKDVPTL